MPVSIPLTLRVEGIEEVTKAIGSLQLSVADQLQTLRMELTTRMATIEEQVAAANAAIDGVVGDIIRIKDDLAKALEDNQGAINSAVEAAMSNASTQLQGVVDRLQALDAENPAPETPAEPPAEPPVEEPPAEPQP